MAVRTSLLALVSLAGCGDLPEVRYETRFIDLATDFDAPVCRGTRVALDDRFEYVGGLRSDHPPDRMLLYWVDHEIERVCSGEKLGCFIPGTRVAAAYQPALHHEIVHAVLDTRGRNVFVEEGLAEYLGGYPVVYDPDQGAPLDALTKGDENGEDAGSISYPAAASFAHFLGRTGGREIITDLIDAVDSGLSGTGIERIIDREFGDLDLQSAYKEGMSTVTQGLDRHTVDSISVDRWGGIHRFGVDCASSDTFGPLTTDRPEGFQVRSVWFPGDTTFSWSLDGPPGSWVALAPVYDRDERIAIDWLAPDLETLGHDRVSTDDGRVHMRVRRGEHALIIVAPADDHYELHLRVNDVRTVYEGAHRTGP